MGHQTPLSIVLRCTCGRYERIHSLIGDIFPGEWAIILDPMQRRGRHASMGMCLVSSYTLDSMTWKWMIRKNHHVGPSKCSKGGHHYRV
ncbi:hypothetical protein YC2023_081925 [Brassica napus]